MIRTSRKQRFSRIQLRPLRGIKEAGVTNLIKRFLADRSGATAIEYGLIAAGISMAIIAVVRGIGTQLYSTFDSVKTALGG